MLLVGSEGVGGMPPAGSPRSAKMRSMIGLFSALGALLCAGPRVETSKTSSMGRRSVIVCALERTVNLRAMPIAARLGIDC